MRIGSIRRAWKCSVGRWTGLKLLQCCSSLLFAPSSIRLGLDGPHVTSMALNRLGSVKSRPSSRVAGNKTLQRMTGDVERTDGIPLFVEEMTKAVLEAAGKGLPQARRCHSILLYPVPASLHASLMARLTGSAPQRRWRRSGQMGREFSHALLAAVVAQTGNRTPVCARPSHCGRFAVPAGRSAARDLSVQARTCTGRGLRDVAPRATPRPSRSYRRNSRKPIPRNRRKSARVIGASLHRSRAD